MALQGRHEGTSSQEGSCENANLERQGCGPFYQDVIQDACVDPVSGSSCFAFYSPSHSPPFSSWPYLPQDTFEMTSKMPLTRF